jgi:hypothetical protein
VSDRNRAIALVAVLVLRALAAASTSLADWVEKHIVKPGT